MTMMRLNAMKLATGVYLARGVDDIAMYMWADEKTSWLYMMNDRLHMPIAAGEEAE